MQVRQADHPPQILQIYREAIRSGQEAAYAAVEKEISRICRTLKCPHPYLGSQSLTGANEVWFFNGYQSVAEQQQVLAAYAVNTQLTTAMIEASTRKAALTEAPFEVFANHRPDLTRGVPWVLGRGRFLVVSVTIRDPLPEGTVFEAPDGMRLIFTAAGSRDEADRGPRGADTRGPPGLVDAGAGMDRGRSGVLDVTRTVSANLAPHAPGRPCLAPA